MLQGIGYIGHMLCLIIHKSVHALANHTQALLDRLLEGTTDGHYLTHTLHTGTQLVVHAVELGKVPTGNLAYHIVKSGFEEGAGGFGDRVLQLEQTIPQAQLGSHKCQRIASSLAGQSRRTAQACVHLDDSIIFGVGIEGILNVTLTNDADVADNLDGQCTQLVVLTVRQGLTGSYHDRLAGMDTEGIEILHVANGDTVVITVANHLVLYLLPALQGFLHQNLGRE